MSFYFVLQRRDKIEGEEYICNRRQLNQEVKPRNRGGRYRVRFGEKNLNVAV